MPKQPEFDENVVEENRKGIARHMQALRACDVLGPETTAKSHVYPGTDSMSVFRHGPQRLASSVVEVSLIDGGYKGTCFLSAADARRIGIALVNAAEEIDGVDGLRIGFAPKGQP